MKKNKNFCKLNRIRIGRAKFSLDDGFAERPFYIIKAMTTEKDKGIEMRELIKNTFNIDSQEEREFFRKRLQEWNKDVQVPTELPKQLKDKSIKFTRDDKGNIVSPFRSKKKIFEKV